MTRRSFADHTFAVEDGHLVRTARRHDGAVYQHRCSLDGYKGGGPLHR